MPDLVIGNDNLASDGDSFYEMLMRAHEGLTEEESHALNMRLLLIMANQIGHLEILEKVIRAASKN